MSQPDEPRRLDRDRNADGKPENARPRDRYGAPLPRDAEDEMPDRVEPEEVVSQPAEAVDHAVRLMAQERFFEAHEFFEWAWKGPSTDDDDRAFFKGMAQIAVGYTHLQRGNPTGAMALLDRGAAQLRAYAPVHAGIDVAETLGDAERVRAAVAAGETVSLPPPRLAPHG